MVDIVSTDSRSRRKRRVEWIWKSNPDLFGHSQAERWDLYSDVEIEIIEEAFQNKKLNVIIDDYHIDLEHFLQISNKNINNQRPVMRQEEEHNAKRRIRSNRFYPIDPIIPHGSFCCVESDDNEGLFADIAAHFKIYGQYDTSDNLRMMVEEAAKGIIIEGELAGKQIEAEWMVQQLQNKKESSAKEIWQCCAHLYTMNSFLYTKINEIMRLVGDGDETHRKIWKSKVPTLGPFIWLLNWLKEPSSSDLIIQVYRGARLPKNLIENYQNSGQKNLCIFPAFTSTTRDQEVAAFYADNAIFIMDISLHDGIDVQPYSNFPDEQEILLSPDFLFVVKSCKKVNNVWNIYLTSVLAVSEAVSSSAKDPDSMSSLEEDPDSTECGY